jgi:2-polyprenyl-3-methyl-5-hydroxy-6-metoxy-1,4-benzoquinol methylase
LDKTLYIAQRHCEIFGRHALPGHAGYIKRGKTMKLLKSLFPRDYGVCPWWLAYTFDNSFRRFLHNPEALLNSFVREGMTVADIGCGMGYFSIAMAKMVGDKGAVIAVDLQQEMLDIMRKRAEKAGVASRIRPRYATEDDIRIKEPVDFVLAFWMVHEAKDIPRFFAQLSSILRETGKVLIAEPKIHVPHRGFQETLGYARAAGFRINDAPHIRISRAVILSKNV